KRSKSFRRPKRAADSQLRERPVAQHSCCVRIHGAHWHHRVAAIRRTCPLLAGFSLPPLSDAAVMNDAIESPAVSVVVPVFNQAENMSILQSELGSALTGLNYEIVFVDDG